jgi:hypothetical protein
MCYSPHVANFLDGRKLEAEVAHWGGIFEANPKNK